MIDIYIFIYYFRNKKEGKEKEGDGRMERWKDGGMEQKIECQT